MAEPVVAQKAPYEYTAQQDEKVAWCRCGKSAKQPFCDGAHRGSEFRPLLVDLKAGETVYFCGCKHTGNAPYCDGSHNKL